MPQCPSCAEETATLVRCRSIRTEEGEELCPRCAEMSEAEADMMAQARADERRTSRTRDARILRAVARLEDALSEVKALLKA